MENILKNIAILRGVRHACIYQEGKGPVSNFPDEFNASMASSYNLIDQIFSALKAIDKSHNEIYFSMGNKFLVAYLLDETCIALLLTDKKINFPLLNMGIKSASMKVKQIIKKEAQQTQIPTPLVASATQEYATKNQPVDGRLQIVLEKLSNILKQYLGPAAIFIFEDDIAKWGKTYIQNYENLPHLIEIIKKELAPTSEQQEFEQQALAIIDVTTEEKR
jgi:predicted regulator of Ras-like GTPase activity (Roadblock/LC7/MglB family)